MAGRCGPGSRPEARPTRTYRIPWADLLKKVFAIDVLACPDCGGWLKVITFIAEAAVAKRILDCLGLDSRPRPLPAPRRRPRDSTLRPSTMGWTQWTQSSPTDPALTRPSTAWGTLRARLPRERERPGGDVRRVTGSVRSEGSFRKSSDPKAGCHSYSRRQEIVLDPREVHEALAGGASVVGKLWLDIDQPAHRHRLWSFRDSPIAYQLANLGAARRPRNAEVRQWLDWWRPPPRASGSPP